MALISPTVDIAVLAIIVTGISVFLQGKLTDRKKMKKQQDEMKEKQKRIKELSKNSDKKSKKEMARIQMEILEASTEMMKGSMKYMMVSMVVFLPILYAITFLYSGTKTIIGNVTIPFTSWVVPSYLAWYIGVGIISGIILNAIVKAMDKRKEEEQNKKEERVQAEQK
ncbi:MAG: EMC3/TMCO1 family protein [Candidatus Diapherotrites archaeon]